VLKEGKVYVLKDKELRAEVIWLHYNVLAVRHGGRWKTVCCSNHSSLKDK